MARPGRRPNTRKAVRRVALMLKREHADLIRRWAEEGGCSQSEALGVVFDSLWEELSALELSEENDDDIEETETSGVTSLSDSRFNHNA